MSSLRLWTVCVIFLLLSTACSTQYPETCPSSSPVGLANAKEIASDGSLPFRFPLDESPIDNHLYYGWFGVSNECTPDIVDCYVFPERKFHAAEDYKRPAERSPPCRRRSRWPRTSRAGRCCSHRHRRSCNRHRRRSCSHRSPSRHWRPCGWRGRSCSVAAR